MIFDTKSLYVVTYPDGTMYLDWVYTNPDAVVPQRDLAVVKEKCGPGASIVTLQEFLQNLIGLTSDEIYRRLG